jgi:hypothetical protein
MANLSRELNNATGANGLDQGGLWKEVTDGSRFPFSIPTIYTVHGRVGPQNYTWGNSDNIWTNYHNYMNNGNDHPRAFWWCLNDIRLDNNGHADGGLENFDHQTMRVIQYAGSRMAGSIDTQYFVHPHGASNNSIEYRQMYLRNFHPTTPFSVTVYGTHSDYWSSGHDGSSLILWTPNVNGSYAAVTGGTWTTLANRTGQSNIGYTWSGTFTIQPQTTVVVQQNNTMHYWTNSSQAKKLFASNAYYRLEDTFGANYGGAFWIQPDLRMTFTAATYSQPGENTHNTSADVVYKIWNRAAQLYGNR